MVAYHPSPAAPNPSAADLVFHAMADATRRDILETALREELSVSALGRRYPMSLTAVQKHVAVLEKAGLVSRRRHGREQLVRGELAPLRDALTLLDRLELIWRDRLARFEAVLSETPSHPGGTP